MTTPLRAACIQLEASTDQASNVARAEQLVMEGVDQGATLLALPEKWQLPGQPKLQHSAAEPLDGPLMDKVREWSRTHGVWLLSGSFVELVEGEERRANTSVLVAPDGEIAAVYRKIHMFDVEIDGVSYRESELEIRGNELVMADMNGVGLGMTICYDLRFPEVYRALALRGAQILTVPSCFTRRTGQDHWEVLLRARAIENGCFVLAPNIIGSHGRGRESYGRSMIIDAWGTVLATAPDRDGVIVADLSFEDQDRVRSSIPSLANRIPDAYV